MSITLSEMYKIVQPMYAICTAGKGFLGSSIRLLSASRVKLNPLVEACRMRMANHCGLIVEEGGQLKVAEMLGTGLEINPLSDYFFDEKDVIVSVRKLSFTELQIQQANNFVLTVHKTGCLKYSTVELLNFFSVNRNVPKNMYCSELCEIVANRFNKTWSHNQLGHRKEAAGIAPCEIQYGCGEKIWDRYPK